MKKYLWLLCFFIIGLSKALHAEIQTGSCAADGTLETCQYTLDTETKVLTISGNGKMKNYSHPTDVPWPKDISEVHISGITSIGNYAFYTSKLESITIPATVTSIGASAIHGMPNLTTVNFEENSNLQEVGRNAFAYNPNLQTFEFPDKLKSLQHNTFFLSGVTSVVLPDSLFEEGSYLDVAAFKNGMTIYCSEEKASACLQYFKQAKELCIGPANLESSYCSIQNVNLKTYQKYGDNYFYNGKFYAHPNDILSTNYIKKRIYTVEEANNIAGRKNRVSIRYR